MIKIFTFIDRVTPKNYILKLLSLTFYCIFISICFKLLISEVLNLKIVFQGNITYKLINKNIYLLFGVIVLFVPLIETTLFQWLPLLFYNYFKVSQKFDYLFILISGLIFGLIHTYSIGYQITTTIIGVIFMILSMYYADKKKIISFQSSSFIL